MKDIPKQLKPYFRKVIAHPEEAVVHYGDCNVFDSNVCDCGLLRTLLSMKEPEKWYGNFHEEIIKHEARIKT